MTESTGNRLEPSATIPSALPAGWERDTLEKVLLATVTEQRRNRRWNIAFRAVLLIYLGVFLWLVAQPLVGKHHFGGKKHTSIIDVTGTIAAGQPANAESLIAGLRAASEDSGTQGIILRMNTPGGTPVQAASVYDEIRRIKQRKPELPIYAVITDLCASGGYYIASATDRIFVNNASMIGSIGVIMSNFGFVEAMSKLGVERRVMTAGAHKAILDPFLPIDPVARDHMQSVLNTVHQQFITAVKQGRGARLKDDPQLFSGLVWNGGEGIRLGLADEFGDVRHVAEDVIGAKELVNFTPKENLLDRVTKQFGVAVGRGLAMTVSESRLGLQ